MDLNKIAKLALKNASGDKVEVVVIKNDEALTRFANSYIHQNVKQTNGTVEVRVVRDGKTGVAETNSFEENSVVNCAKKANELADLAVKDPQEYELPGKSEYKKIPAPDKMTINLSPEERAGIVAKMVSIADKDNLKVAGSVSNTSTSYCTVNNKGVETELSHAYAKVGITAMSDDSSGQADMLSPRISDINHEELVNAACKRALLGKNPKEIDAGEYEVVMLPYATAELLVYMIYTGIPAQSADEGRSWMANNMGKQILSEKFTMIDDPFNDMMNQYPFDKEGFPKKKLTLIEKGTPKNLVFNSYYSAKMNKPNTGHGMGGMGAFPTHNIMMSGDKSAEEMISTVKKGILISRFWYTNIMDPMSVELTTMTRDGLFLIEDGKITTGLKNMRVTDKVLRVFKDIISVGNDPRNNGFIVAPSVHLKGLNFSGNTKY